MGGFVAHVVYCKSNPNRIKRIKSINAHRPKGIPAWNKGLSLKDSLELKLISYESYLRSVVGSIKGGSNSSGVGRTPEIESERRRKIAEHAKEKNGGYREGSGIGKKGWYKGFFCDSSYELAYVIYCLDHKINIVRNTEKRQYIWNGEIRKYIPDFIVDGKVIEIKGYKSPQWEAKLKANPDVVALYQQDLNYVFEYVTKVYGKDFIKMYE